MSRLPICFAALGLFLTLGSSSARADSFTTGDYYSGDQNNFVNGEIAYTLGGNAETGAAGNITHSSGVIGGKAVTFSSVYCVDINDFIYLNTTYNATYTSDGTVKGAAVNNAGQISWLLLNLAGQAKTTAQNEGLQAAIWATQYPSFALSQSNDPAVIAAFNADIAALGMKTAPLSAVNWITVLNTDGSFAQAQAGLTPTPEPGSLALLCTGMLGMGAIVRRRLFAR